MIVVRLVRLKIDGGMLPERAVWVMSSVCSAIDCPSEEGMVCG